MDQFEVAKCGLLRKFAQTTSYRVRHSNFFAESTKDKSCHTVIGCEICERIPLNGSTDQLFYFNKLGCAPIKLRAR